MSDAGDTTTVSLAHVANHWDEVLDDAAATAAEYRSAGRTAIELHPGDVALSTGGRGRTGFDVVVPGEEYERLRSALADHEIDAVDVFSQTAGGVVFLLVAAEAGDELAVLFPLYYGADDAATLRRLAANDPLQIHVRPLDPSEAVSITVGDSGPFVPADSVE